MVNDLKPSRSSSLGHFVDNFPSVADAANDINSALANRFQPSVEFDELSLPTSTDHCMNFGEISCSEVKHAIRKLRAGSAPGPDGLPAWFLRLTCDFICVPLAKLFTRCFRSGICPREVCTGTVILLPKTRSPKSLSELRPITLTNALAKIMERIAFFRVQEHFVSTIGPEQHAYRAFHSTNTALTHLIHSWLQFLDLRSSHYIRILFIDFSKAFDSVEPSLLIGKLASYNFPQWFVTWSWNFLSCRSQRVRLHDCLSEYVLTHRGIPQGTILGPALFSVMINDLLPWDTSKSSLTKYADDQTLSHFVSKDDADQMQTELNLVNKWCAANGLSLNSSKTKEMVISFSKTSPSTDPLYLNNNLIECVSSYKLLGLTVCNTLSWSMHVDKVITRSRSLLFLIRMIAGSFSFDSVQLSFLVDSLLVPVLTYAFPAWCNLTYRDYKRLSSTYLKALRITNPNVDSASFKRITDQQLLSLFKKCLAPTHPLHCFIPKRSARASRNRRNIIPILETHSSRFHNHFIVSGTTLYNDCAD